MSSGKAQVNDDLEPGELPSYEALLVPARDGEGILSRAYIVRPNHVFRESIPFLYRRKGIFIFYDSCHASRRCVKMLMPNLSVFPEYAFL